MLQRTIKIYATEKGREPFSEWLGSLRDERARKTIQNRLRRLKLGNFGDCEFVGEGVFELRFFFGSGFRIYFAEYSAGFFIFLLCAGDKKTQVRDIQKAQEYWKECKERRYDRYKTI